MKNGYVHIYTGDGKGKTTAALGLGLRAVGSGLRVRMYQFLKGTKTGELRSIEMLGTQFEIVRFAEQDKYFWQLDEEEKQAYREVIQKEWQGIIDDVTTNAYDLIILDEIMGAIKHQMISIDQVMALFAQRHLGVELILTGRNVPEEIVKQADLVTEMKMIKHYYQQGVKSRQGIEY